MIEAPDSAIAQRIIAERPKVAGLAKMLRQHCRFSFRNGATVRQRRIGDRSYLATFIVTRPDGIERIFRHGLGGYEAALAFATAEHVERSIDGKDHPLMQASHANG